MEQNPKSWFLAVSMMLLLAVFQPKILGCGTEFGTPSNHFNGVNEYGDLSYWEKVGDLDMGEGLSFPLLINFKSSRESNSAYAGKGWIITPFDVSMTQLEENLFHMYQPNGTNTYFRRNNANQVLLYGSGTWLAEISGDTITAYASCGWKMIFSKGKITGIQTPNNRRIDFEYSNGRMTAVREGGKNWLRVETDLQTGEVRLNYQDRQLSLFQGKKPLVQNVNGQNLIAGMDQSLSQIKTEDRTVKSFEYGVDEKLNPTFKVKEGGDGERRLTWDATSKQILRDGEWTYNITPSSRIGINAAIGRKDAKGQEEFWFKDKIKGQETVRMADGVKTIRRWFLSGKLAGKLRDVQQISPEGMGIEIYKASYNENGQIVREKRQSGREVVRQYDLSGRLLKESEFLNESLIKEVSVLYSDSNETVIEVKENGLRKKRVYGESGEFSESVEIIGG